MKESRKSLWALWILLTSALAMFIAFSLSGDIAVGEWHMAKAGFRQTLMDDEKTPVIIDDILTINLDSLLMPKPPIEGPDTTIHNVLVIGDSMTHNLAKAISQYGSKNNYRVTGVTWESSSMPLWVRSERLQKYLDEVKPDFIFISLGSNETYLKNYDNRVPMVDTIISRLHGVPFVWVGPPLWKKDNGIYSMLEKALPSGTLFKSEGIEMARGKDKIHPTPKGAVTWVDSLMRWIPESRHPILAEKPDSFYNNPNHNFIIFHLRD